MKPQRWVFDHQAFSYLDGLMTQNGGRLELTSGDLGFALRGRTAAKKPAELI
jgi:hypothetical protein